MPKGSIAYIYNTTKTGTQDLPALSDAAQKVCSKRAKRLQRLHAVGLGLPPAPPPPQAGTEGAHGGGTAAVHLRIGDTLLSAHQKYYRYPPAEMYLFVASELTKANISTVVMYYHPTRGVAAHKHEEVLKRCGWYIDKFSKVMESYNIRTVKAAHGSADDHFCEMVDADVYVGSGGGYSRLVEQLRRYRTPDRHHDVPTAWWCGKDVADAARQSANDAAANSTGDFGATTNNNTINANRTSIITNSFEDGHRRLQLQNRRWYTPLSKNMLADALKHCTQFCQSGRDEYCADVDMREQLQQERQGHHHHNHHHQQHGHRRNNRHTNSESVS